MWGSLKLTPVIVLTRIKTLGIMLTTEVFILYLLKSADQDKQEVLQIVIVIDIKRCPLKIMQKKSLTRISTIAKLILLIVNMCVDKIKC